MYDNHHFLIDIKIWNMIADIIWLNVVPSPRNPFEVDHEYFENLSLEEYILSSGAMIHFLQRVLMHGDHSYHTKGISTLHNSI